MLFGKVRLLQIKLQFFFEFLERYVAWTLTLHCMLRTFGLSRILAHANNSWLPYYMSHPLSFNVPRHKSSHNSREQNTLIYVILKWKNSFFINYLYVICRLIEKLYSSQLIRHIPPVLYILEFGLTNCITTIYSDGFRYPKLFWIELEVCLDAIFFFLTADVMRSPYVVDIGP